MPALIFSAFAIMVLISFLLGFILAYPLGGLILTAVIMIVAAIHDYRKGVL